ncbi:uncharacterized protein LOC123519829 [Portunus trituberculatus]|uniref:uncharacterized protein LOC123519829 n=1 Tax=Portunus trituberculatus TaxID=210409 RepID=UPI001E1D19AD|nr:uncharacterized protein LOC123519829 [Portunus trituberculatus]
MTPQTRVTFATPSNFTEKKGRAYESIGREWLAEESQVEPTRSEGKLLLSAIDHGLERKNVFYREQEVVDEEKWKEELFINKTNDIINLETAEQIFTQSSDNSQDISEIGSIEHNQNATLSSHSGNDTHFVGEEEDADRVTDKRRKMKNEDGSDGDCVNATNKCDSHAGGKDNNSMTGVDLGGEELQRDIEEGDRVIIWDLPKLNVTGIGLYVPMPPEFFRQLLAPVYSEGRLSAHPIPLLDSSVALLRDGSAHPPVLALTAPSHARRSVASPCSRSCGGGIRTISQVCVEVETPEKQVAEDKCLGLPNYHAPFNQICNTFPCRQPRWVAGSWSTCSAWCGAGLQYRLVGCIEPLLEDAAPYLAWALFVKPTECPSEQPLSVRVCEGPCQPVDCSLPANTLHLACTSHLPDPPLEQDHLSDYAVNLTFESSDPTRGAHALSPRFGALILSLVEAPESGVSILYA